MPRGHATGNTEGQSLYIQEHVHAVAYQIVTINTWYCAWCHDGPMSLDINTHCASCGRYRDQHSIIESRQERRPVIPRRSRNGHR